MLRGLTELLGLGDLSRPYAEGVFTLPQSTLLFISIVGKI